MIKEFQEELLSWFIKARREFPWRNTSNPYYIIVAEKLLQQTKAGNVVIEAYSDVIRHYPSTYELAKADINYLEEILQPLGLSFRAKHLISMAQEIVNEHNGAVPSDMKSLLRLTGIGEYCARAVLSFAFHQDISVVDTNVGRLLFRIFGIARPFPKNPSRKKYLQELANS